MMMCSKTKSPAVARKPRDAAYRHPPLFQLEFRPWSAFAVLRHRVSEESRLFFRAMPLLLRLRSRDATR